MKAYLVCSPWIDGLICLINRRADIAAGLETTALTEAITVINIITC